MDTMTTGAATTSAVTMPATSAATQTTTARPPTVIAGPAIPPRLLIVPCPLQTPTIAAPTPTTPAQACVLPLSLRNTRFIHAYSSTRLRPTTQSQLVHAPALLAAAITVHAM